MRTYEELAACSLQGVTSDPPGYPTFYEAWDGSDCSEYYYYYYPFLFFLLLLLLLFLIIFKVI